jgi:hypothetical protein
MNLTYFREYVDWEKYDFTEEATSNIMIKVSKEFFGDAADIIDANKDIINWSESKYSIAHLYATLVNVFHYLVIVDDYSHNKYKKEDILNFIQKLKPTLSMDDKVNLYNTYKRATENKLNTKGGNWEAGKFEQMLVQMDSDFETIINISNKFDLI